jgi:hypothetical protein
MATGCTGPTPEPDRPAQVSAAPQRASPHELGLRRRRETGGRRGPGIGVAAEYVRRRRRIRSTPPRPRSRPDSHASISPRLRSRTHSRCTKRSSCLDLREALGEGSVRRPGASDDRLLGVLPDQVGPALAVAVPEPFPEPDPPDDSRTTRHHPRGRSSQRTVSARSRTVAGDLGVAAVDHPAVGRRPPTAVGRRRPIGSRSGR